MKLSVSKVFLDLDFFGLQVNVRIIIVPLKVASLF